MYVRNITRRLHGTPAEAAAKAKDHGLSWVAIMACWQESDRHTPMNLRDLEPYAAAFREAGIDVWIWGYPWGGRESEFCDAMGKALELSGGSGILIDPELGYKAPDSPLRARRLVGGTLDLLNESQGLGVTSYGLTTAHRTFPWDSFAGVGFGSPQVYTVHLKTAELALRQWKALGWDHVIASVPTFGKKSGAQIPAYAGELQKLCDGLIFWSWRSTSRAEWREIAKLTGA